MHLGKLVRGVSVGCEGRKRADVDSSRVRVWLRRNLGDSPDLTHGAGSANQSRTWPRHMVEGEKNRRSRPLSGPIYGGGKKF